MAGFFRLGVISARLERPHDEREADEHHDQHDPGLGVRELDAERDQITGRAARSARTGLETPARPRPSATRTASRRGRRSTASAGTRTGTSAEAMTDPRTALMHAASRAENSVRVYAAWARGVQTAARNRSNGSRAAVTKHAASGTRTSTARYAIVNPRLSRNPGSTRRLTCAMFPNCSASRERQRPEFFPAELRSLTLPARRADLLSVS